MDWSRQDEHLIKDRYSVSELTDQVKVLEDSVKRLESDKAIMQDHLVTLRNVLVELMEKHCIGESARFRKTLVIDRNLQCDRDALRALSNIFDIVDWVDGFGCVHHFKWKKPS